MSDVNIAKKVKIFSELINLAVIWCRSADPIHRCTKSFSPAMKRSHPTMAAAHNVRVKPSTDV